jgi:hypothetical protein
MYSQFPSRHISYRSATPRLQKSIISRIFFGMAVCALLCVVIKIFVVVMSHQPSAVPEIKSGIAGYCIDGHHNGVTNGTVVDAWSCNGTAAQDWIVRGHTITHDKKYCLSINASYRIASDVCTGAADQVWVSAIDGYENPSSGKCLAVPQNHTGVQLVLADCNKLTEASEIWVPTIWSKENEAMGVSVSCSGSERQKVVCDAAKEWVVWQSGSVDHNQLLNTYADGNGYEEWCADFISYVYKEAGYPFTAGERDGWDEYLATNMLNMGFAYHDAANYTPQAGDVAFFDYPGGHVELVVIGGAKPLFIYGDSGTTDPTTGNGEMAENTITSDDSLGGVTYYLSPN